MICFAFERKYRGYRAMDERAQANTHRMAARGNATHVPLPWQDLVQQLQDGQAMTIIRQSASLPRTCTELTHVVSILLKHISGW